MYAVPKRRARAPDSARLQLIDSGLSRGELRLDSANVQLGGNLFSQRRKKLRRKRLAIELRAIANRSKFFELGIDHRNASLELVARFTVSAFHARAEQLRQCNLLFRDGVRGEIPVSRVEGQRCQVVRARPWRRGQPRKIDREITLRIGHLIAIRESAGRVLEPRAPAFSKASFHSAGVGRR